MRVGALDELDFERFPVGAVGVLALWLVGHRVSAEDAVARLRATNVGPHAMRDAFWMLPRDKPEGHVISRARRLLLDAAESPPSVEAHVP
jgi:hypothetical protein